MSSRLFDCRWVVVWLALWALVGVPSQVMAQTPELVTAVPSNQLTDATPAQTTAINRLQQRPTTQALSLVTVNIDALHSDTVRVVSRACPP